MAYLSKVGLRPTTKRGNAFCISFQNPDLNRMPRLKRFMMRFWRLLISRTRITTNS